MDPFRNLYNTPDRIAIRNDIVFPIAVGTGKTCTYWKREDISISGLFTRLGHNARDIGLTRQEYEALKSGDKISQKRASDAKDGAGFFGGILSGTRKTKDSVIARTLINLDFDEVANAEKMGEILQKVANLKVCFCAYSTASHTPDKPRFRVIFPVTRSMSPVEFETVSQRIAQKIDIDAVDEKSWKIDQFMYDSAHISDVQPFFTYQDGELVNPDVWLTSFESVQTPSQTAQERTASRVDTSAQRTGKADIRTDIRQAIEEARNSQNPREKAGWIGAFCRVYDIESAIATFLTGIYEKYSNDRYTYVKGSSVGGLVIYQGGLLAYSNHSTDPIGDGHCHDAFGLVRVHLFRQLDGNVLPETPVNRVPSFKAMIRLAKQDPKVKAEYERVEAEKCHAELKELAESVGVADINNTALPEHLRWKALELDHTRQLADNDNNIWIILENDPELAGKIGLNEMTKMPEILGALPWEADPKHRAWTDSDVAGLYNYLGRKPYRLNNYRRIDIAFTNCAYRHKFNEIRDYLIHLPEWDGKPRVETLLVKYLGAEDTVYTRAVTRKFLIAAVRRILDPGCKFDQMLILTGKQGMGKSTFLSKLMHKQEWFTDALKTFGDKESCEVLRGIWLAEISELEAFRKSEVTSIKSFLSQQVDRYRPAYGKHLLVAPRTCVFAGTTNSDKFLRDRTGNRRFWAVDCRVKYKEADFQKEPDSEIAQIWAEVMVLAKTGEATYLDTPELVAIAQEIQEDHEEEGYASTIRAMFEEEIPENWYSLSIAQRREYIQSGGHVQWEVPVRKMKRTKICVAELWCEHLRGELKDLTPQKKRELNLELTRLLEDNPEWRKNNPRFGSSYGQTWGWCRVEA